MLKIATAVSEFTGKFLDKGIKAPGVGDNADQVQVAARTAGEGDLAMVGDMLPAQTITLGYRLINFIQILAAASLMSAR